MIFYLLLSSTKCDQLNDLVPAFKVSSSDITNIPLLRKISGKGKPILLSTGASNINEIKFAIKNQIILKTR